MNEYKFWRSKVRPCPPHCYLYAQSWGPYLFIFLFNFFFQQILIPFLCQLNPNPNSFLLPCLSPRKIKAFESCRKEKKKCHSRTQIFFFYRIQIIAAVYVFRLGHHFLLTLFLLSMQHSPFGGKCGCHTHTAPYKVLFCL